MHRNSCIFMNNNETSSHSHRRNYRGNQDLLSSDGNTTRQKRRKQAVWVFDEIDIDSRMHSNNGDIDMGECYQDIDNPIDIESYSDPMKARSASESYTRLKDLVNPRDYVNAFEQYFLEWIFERGLGQDLANEILSLCKVFHIYQCISIDISKDWDHKEMIKSLHFDIRFGQFTRCSQRSTKRVKNIMGEMDSLRYL